MYSTYQLKRLTSEIAHKLINCDYPEPEIRFDIAEGLYWHCTHWHEGQWSDRYKILCELEFKPGRNHSGPYSHEAQYVYDLLEKDVKSCNKG